MQLTFSNALFISDLHLCEERQNCNRAFFSFLEWLPDSTDALFILGDFFEYWVGDDLQTPLAKAIAEALSTCAKKKSVSIFFLPGNRDFAVGDKYCTKAGMTLLDEESLFNIAGKTIAVSHGDIYCTDDKKYQRYRRIIRNPFVLKTLLMLPKKIRIQIAEKLRLASKNRFQREPYFVDVTPKAINDAITKLNCDVLIHGHTHIADIHLIGEPEAKSKRIVLGDWHQVGWYAKISDHGESLHRFTINSPTF
jgi:UDP-2,3-diacylglucosamine hydrolase